MIEKNTAYAGDIHEQNIYNRLDSELTENKMCSDDHTINLSSFKN